MNPEINDVFCKKRTLSGIKASAMDLLISVECNAIICTEEDKERLWSLLEGIENLEAWYAPSL